MKNSKFIFITLLVFCACSENTISPPNSPQPDYSPMWPQVGYNGRHTGNRNCPKVPIKSVDSGEIYWTFNPGQGSYGDGTESSIDANGNIYHLSTLHNTGNVIKFRPDGSVIWRRDSLMNDAYFGIAFSKDEKRIYYGDYSKFCCRDSSGNLLWSIPSFGSSSFPAIAKDGTIYCAISNQLTAIMPEGTIKWHLNINAAGYCWPALDKEEYIYSYNNWNGSTEEVNKIDKSGNILWKYDINLIYGNYLSIIIDCNNNIYFKSDTGLVSLNKNGDRRWIRKRANTPPYTVPAITKDNHIITDSANYVIALDTSGSVLWKVNIPNSQRWIEPYFTLDDYDNIYFNYWNNNYAISVCSFDKNGMFRWNCDNPAVGWVLPGLVLSPLGQIFDTPKRPNVVFSIK